MYFCNLRGHAWILKTGIRVHNLTQAIRVWKIYYCALHDMLLEVDALNVPWTDRVPSYWEGEAMLHDQNDVAFAINRLHNPSQACSYDSSGVHLILI